MRFQHVQKYVLFSHSPRHAARFCLCAKYFAKILNNVSLLILKTSLEHLFLAVLSRSKMLKTRHFSCLLENHIFASCLIAKEQVDIYSHRLCTFSHINKLTILYSSWYNIKPSRLNMSSITIKNWNLKYKKKLLGFWNYQFYSQVTRALWPTRYNLFLKHPEHHILHRELVALKASLLTPVI